ncbi:hypothetical protein C8R48DRAFT_677096 [Suillus tomentosus]|nr:hypothetical protein C8R48DRAFT_677096 [Suillus tomentosus]
MRATVPKFGYKFKPLEAKNRLDEQSFVEEGSPWLKGNEEVPQLASPSSRTTQQGCASSSSPVTAGMRYVIEFIFSQLLKAVTLGLLVVSFNWNGNLFSLKSQDGDRGVILSRLDHLQLTIRNQRFADGAFSYDASSQADLIPMQDFALISSGAFPIPPLTSTFSTTPSSWHVWNQASDQQSFDNSANVALTTDESCWRIPRTRGHLGVGFQTPVIITHISIEHRPSQPMDAPRDVVLWGFLEQVDNLQRYTSVDLNMDDQPPREVIEESRKQNPTGSFIKLAHVEYSPFHHSHVQTFPVHENILRSGFDFGLVVIEIRENWGADETCLYRVRVHGKDIPTECQVLQLALSQYFPTIRFFDLTASAEGVNLDILSKAADMQGVFTCIKAFTCIILEWIVTALSDVNALHAAILTKELNTTNLEALKHILSDPERISMQVQRLQEFARFLNEELNTFSLIFRLPTELLLNVMYFVAQDEDGLESLIACSRVCRVLRAITIQSPRLWYHAMDMGAPENCVLIALARSHPHHLRISVDLPHQFNSVKLLNHELNLLHIMKSMHRIKSLNLNLVLPQFLHQVLIKFPNSSHSLEYLAIGAVAGTAHVPDVVFALDAPRLQSLRITCCTFSWDALRFHNLLELRIFDAPKHPGVKPSLSMLLNMLSSLPLLKVVVLHNVLSDLDYIFGTDLPLVLPALETLEIEALSPDCTLFLSSIDTPSLISLKIIEEITEFADPIQDLFESIRNKVRNLTIHALQVVCSPNHWEVAGFSQGLHNKLCLIHLSVVDIFLLSYSGASWSLPFLAARFQLGREKFRLNARKHVFVMVRVIAAQTTCCQCSFLGILMSQASATDDAKDQRTRNDSNEQLPPQNDVVGPIEDSNAGPSRPLGPHEQENTSNVSSVGDLATEAEKIVAEKDQPTLSKLGTRQRVPRLEQYTIDMDIVLTFIGFGNLAEAGSTPVDPASVWSLTAPILWIPTIAYASLSMSLLAAFVAVLGKQWLGAWVLQGDELIGPRLGGRTREAQAPFVLRAGEHRLGHHRNEISRCSRQGSTPDVQTSFLLFPAAHHVTASIVRSGWTRLFEVFRGDNLIYYYEDTRGSFTPQALSALPRPSDSLVAQFQKALWAWDGGELNNDTVSLAVLRKILHFIFAAFDISRDPAKVWNVFVGISHSPEDFDWVVDYFDFIYSDDHDHEATYDILLLFVKIASIDAIDDADMITKLSPAILSVLCPHPGRTPANDDPTSFSIIAATWAIWTGLSPSKKFWLAPLFVPGSPYLEQKEGIITAAKELRTAASNMLESFEEVTHGSGEYQDLNEIDIELSAISDLVDACHA